MENQNENAQQKKTWITPELMMETVEETEGKDVTMGAEFGTLYGPS
jgi:hypothetical protein